MIYYIANLYRIFLLWGYSTHNANPPVEMSGSLQHIWERRQHPDIHQPNCRNPGNNRRVISQGLKNQKLVQKTNIQQQNNNSINPGVHLGICRSNWIASSIRISECIKKSVQATLQ